MAKVKNYLKRNIDWQKVIDISVSKLKQTTDKQKFTEWITERLNRPEDNLNEILSEALLKEFLS